MRSRGWGPHDGINALKRRDIRELALLLYKHTKKRSCEHMTRWWPPTSQEKRTQNETYLAGTLTLDILDIRTKRNKFPLFKSPSRVQLFVTPWTAARQASLSLTISRSVSKFTSLALVMPSNHLILCCPVLLLPSVFPSIRVFSRESALCIRCPKYWSFSFSISPSVEYSGLISFKVDWFDLFAVQGTLKNFLQHHSLKASVLQCLSIFRIHLSHPYKPGEKASE